MSHYEHEGKRRRVEFQIFPLKDGGGESTLKNTAPFADAIEVPHNFVTSNTVVHDTFPDNIIQAEAQTILKRAILYSTNKAATSINLKILNKLSRNIQLYSNVDTVDDDLDEEEREQRYPAY